MMGYCTVDVYMTLYIITTNQQIMLLITLQVPSQFDTVPEHTIPETQEGLHNVPLLHGLRRQPIGGSNGFGRVHQFVGLDALCRQAGVEVRRTRLQVVDVPAHMAKQTSWSLY